MSLHGMIRVTVVLTAAFVLFVVLAVVDTDTPVAKEPAERLASAPLSPAQLERAENEVKQLFRERLAQADTPPHCETTALYLLDQSSSFSDRPDLDYALHGVAAELAERSANLTLIESTYRQWADRYSVDAADRQARALYRLAREFPADRFPELLAASQTLVARELQHPSDSSLESLDSLLQFLFSRSRGNETQQTTVRQLRAELSAERRYRGELAEARETLQTHPDDPHAHRLVGLHLCVRDRLWAIGLSHLAQGDDPSLKQTALRDLENPTTASEQLALGDAWFELARTEPLHQPLALRAAYWYRQAAPRADELSAIKIKDRLASIEREMGIDLSDANFLTAASVPPEASDNEPAEVERPEVAPRVAPANLDSAEPLPPTRTWRAHNMTIWSLAVSHDRTRLATAGEDRLIRVWNLEDGSMQAELAGSENTVFALTFLADDSGLLSGGMDDQLRHWSLAPIQQRVIGRHESYVRSILLDRRGVIITGSDDRHVCFWHPTRGLLDRRQAHESIVYETALSPDGRLLATAGQDRAVKLWITNRPQPVLLAGHQDKVRALSFTPDGKWLISAGEDQRIVFWQLPAGRAVAELRTDEFVYDLAVSPDARWLASAGREKQIRTWDIESREPGPVLTGVGDELKALCFVDNHQLVAVGKDGLVYMWELP
ncbi:MAG: WD40 repeat domain-containing protein [Pirellulaceae bacterium]